MEMDSSQSLSIEIKQYLGLLRRWSWLLVVFAVLGGILTFYYSSQQPKIYEASATVLIDQPQNSTDYTYVLSNDRLAQTYAQLMVQEPILEGVIQRLELDLDVNKMSRTLNVSVVPDTQLLRITIEDEDPHRASQIVNSIGIVFAQQNEELQASRYRETKTSLEAQMLSMDQQIQQTSIALEEFEQISDADPQRDILQVQLETYRSIYQDILRQIVAAESQRTLDTENVGTEMQTPVEEQLTFVEGKIAEISDQIDALGFRPSGPEFAILETKLTAYQTLYKQLVEVMVSSEEVVKAATDDDHSNKEAVESLSAQLDVVAKRILDLTEEINVLGGSADGEVEKDRLESNLALYRQTYANLVQSYEDLRLAEIQNTTRVDLVQPSIPPTDPIRPDIVQNTILGVVVGLMLGGGAAFLIELLDDTVKGPGDVVNQMNLPVIGYISRLERGDYYPITAREPRSPLTEAFRSLRTNIQFASIDHQIYSLMVTSPTPQDGKSTVAANLGVVLAQDRYRVSLIDADLRRPYQHRIFNLPNLHGLTDSLVDPTSNLNGHFQQTQVEGLAILTSGDLPPNPAEMVGSDKLMRLIQRLKDQVDVVIVDTPPVTAVTDPVVLSTRVDGVILVLRPGVTKMAAAIHTADQLKQVGANILGVVLNDVEDKGSKYPQYYRGYHYKYSNYYDASTRRRESENKLWNRLAKYWDSIKSKGNG